MGSLKLGMLEPCSPLCLSMPEHNRVIFCEFLHDQNVSNYFLVLYASRAWLSLCSRMLSTGLCSAQEFSCTTLGRRCRTLDTSSSIGRKITGRAKLWWRGLGWKALVEQSILACEFVEKNQGNLAGGEGASLFPPPEDTIVSSVESPSHHPHLVLSVLISHLL